MARRRTLDEDEEEDDRRSTVTRRSAKRRPSSSPAPLSLLEQTTRDTDDEAASILRSRPAPFKIPAPPPEVAPSIPAALTSQGPGFSRGLADRQPEPMAAMQNMLGKHEGADRQALMDYLKTGGVNLDPATTAWCAAIVNASLGQAGLPTTGSNMARSFLNYGSPVTEPQQGDIAVFQRGGPNAATGHVGFYQGRDANGNILVLGGNQGNQVSVAPFSPNSLLGYRRIADNPYEQLRGVQLADASGQNPLELVGQQGGGFRGPLADRQPGAPPVDDTGPPPPPARPPEGPGFSRGLADRQPGAPPVAAPAQNAPQRPLPTQWSETVHNAPAPGPNENVAQALRDQALREGRMPWAAQAGSGEPSPGIGWSSLFGGGGSSTSPPPSSPYASTATLKPGHISMVDMLTNPLQSLGRWFS